VTSSFFGRVKIKKCQQNRSKLLLFDVVRSEGKRHALICKRKREREFSGELKKLYVINVPVLYFQIVTS